MGRVGNRTGRRLRERQGLGSSAGLSEACSAVGMRRAHRTVGLVGSSDILEILTRGAAVGAFVGVAVVVGLGGRTPARVTGVLFSLAAAARLVKLMDDPLSSSAFLAGEYSIADMAAFPWLRVALSSTCQSRPEIAGEGHNIRRWLDEIAARPAVVRGMAVGSDDERPPGPSSTSTTAA